MAVNTEFRYFLTTENFGVMTFVIVGRQMVILCDLRKTTTNRCTNRKNCIKICMFTLSSKKTKHKH